MAHDVDSLNVSRCLRTVLFCLVLVIIYVGSLYIWRKKDHRDHPSTIKKRFISVFTMAVISPIFTYYGTDFDFFKGNPGLMNLLGLRWTGFFCAFAIPLLLTAILFLGPITLHYVEGMCGIYMEAKYWTSNLQNLIWLRNHLVAPFSEEFTFRACMLPILVPCFGASLSVFICPLFFGVAHLHHLWEKLVMGTNVKQAVFQSLFQLMYTTVFGAYSAYLFIRTGHFLAPFIAHAFCNHMGFPDFAEVFVHPQPTRTLLMFAFVAGLISWVFLLEPSTRPSLYGNSIYL